MTLTKDEELECLKKENKRLKEELDEVWGRLDQAIAQLAGICMNPFSLNFDKPDNQTEEPIGVPGHKRRSKKRKTSIEDDDRRDDKKR